MRAIADLDPNEGTVRLDGVLRESVPGPMWRRQVTYLASEPGWWGDTVQEHFTNWDNACRQIVAVGKSVDSQRVRSSVWAWHAH
jgi:phosphate-transporting ATPase